MIDEKSAKTAILSEILNCGVIPTLSGSVNTLPETTGSVTFTIPTPIPP